MYKYNSINHTNEKTEAFYCLKNNYDKEKTKYYTSSLSDNRNHIIVFSQYFRYRRQWKQVRAGRYKRLAADSRAMPGSGVHRGTDKANRQPAARRVQRQALFEGTQGEVQDGALDGNRGEEPAGEREIPAVH